MRATRALLYFPYVILFFAVNLYGEDLKISAMASSELGKTRT